MTNEQINKNWEQIGVFESRHNQVYKHNDLIQKSRFSLSLVEQKTINFLISLVKPKNSYATHIQPFEYEFQIQDYCKICGIDYQNGKNYKMVRDTLKSLRDKSVVMTLPDGTETSVSWIQKFWSNKGNGKVKIRFDEDISPYIFNLYDNTTRFELLNILQMKSKYSVRMYELCRSWAGLKYYTYTVDDLRKLLFIGNGELVNFKDFRRRVLETSQKEINNLTDLNVIFEPIKKGRKVIKIKFIITKKDNFWKIK